MTKAKQNVRNSRIIIFLRRREVWIFLLLAGCVVLFVKGRTFMRQSYNQAMENAYNGFYQTAFEISEKQNHVSNYAVINIENVQEISRLEVLEVWDTEFVIKDADKESKITSWLEVQGRGVFTVDLTMGEFITDTERQYVLVRVPKPALTNCTLEKTGKQFWKNSTVFNGSIAEGVYLSQDQLGEGQRLLEDSMKQSRRFYESARDSAVSMIKSLVKQWNPNLPDLQVEVEFMEV